MPRAKIAMHAPFGHGLPPAAFIESFGLLKYFQFLHGESDGKTMLRICFLLDIIHPSARPPLIAVFALNAAALRNPREEMLETRPLAP